MCPDTTAITATTYTRVWGWGSATVGLIRGTGTDFEAKKSQLDELAFFMLG
jgi:hypothetical protein